MSTIGDNIQRKRKELGMTQEELAKRLGYKSKSTINKIEMGINDVPQSKIIRFAEVLCTTPAYLMGWNESTEQTNSSDELNISDGEKLLLDLFRRLPDDAQKMYLEVLRASLKNQL